jgi:hypothetical protein
MIRLDPRMTPIFEAASTKIAAKTGHRSSYGVPQPRQPRVVRRPDHIRFPLFQCQPTKAR